MLVEAIANYSGPPFLIGYEATANASLTDGVIIHVPNTLPPKSKWSSATTADSLPILVHWRGEH